MKSIIHISFFSVFNKNKNKLGLYNTSRVCVHCSLNKKTIGKQPTSLSTHKKYIQFSFYYLKAKIK